MKKYINHWRNLSLAIIKILIVGIMLSVQFSLAAITFDQIKNLAEQGDAKAQYQLAIVYLKGLNEVNQNNELALQWLQKSAEQQYDEAQYFLGAILSQGKFVKKDNQKAAKWLLKAANNGHKDAQYLIGLMYLTGKGVDENIQQSIYWLEKSAQQGHFQAQSTLEVIRENQKALGSMLVSIIEKLI